MGLTWPLCVSAEQPDLLTVESVLTDIASHKSWWLHCAIRRLEMDSLASVHMCRRCLGVSGFLEDIFAC